MTMTIEDIFQGVATLNRWVPYKMVWAPIREKFDKIPHNGSHGLSTKEPANWKDLVTALDMVATTYGLSGVGFVMTGGITFDDWTLVGFDFDDVDFDKWKPPFKSYAEKSPSGKGVRMFAWAPTEWAGVYQDTLDTTPPNCAHAEIYIGTAPRFLTVTFDAIQLEEIAPLTPKDLMMIETWGMHLYEEPVKDLPFIDVPGEPVNLDLPKFKFTIDQRHFIAGTVPETGKLDRSRTSMGFIIRLLDNGVSQQDVLATMLSTPAILQYLMDHRNSDPERATEFAKEEINRAYKDSMVGKKEQLIGFNEKWKPAVTGEPKAKDLRFPMELYTNAPGLVGKIAKWIMGFAYTPREEFAYTCAISMVSCLVGPHLTHGSRNGKMNLYFALVGDTGTGKNEAIDGMGALLNETDAKDCMTDFPSSEAGLRRQLTLTPNVLLRIDELAHKFEGMSDTNGSSMGRALLEAYNAVRMPPKPYADSAKSLPAVDNPYVQILGGSTDKVWDVLKSAHVDDGTLNRFIFVCLPHDVEYRYNGKPNAHIPKALKDEINTFWRASRMEDLIGDVPGVPKRAIAYTEEVEAAANDLNRVAWDLQKGEYGNLYSRFVQNTLKIASVLVAGDKRDVVEIKDFEQAHAFMKWSITNTAKKVGAHMASNNFERLEKRLLNKLEKSGGKMGMREAYKFMHIYRREMDELTATLAYSGLIAVETEPSTGIEWIRLT